MATGQSFLKMFATLCMTRELAPRGGFEPPTFRLTAEMIKNLSALSGVAYEKLGAIFPSLAAPTPAATAMTSELVPVGTRSGSLRFPIHTRLLQADFWTASQNRSQVPSERANWKNNFRIARDPPAIGGTRQWISSIHAGGLRRLTQSPAPASETQLRRQPAP